MPFDHTQPPTPDEMRAFLGILRNPDNPPAEEVRSGCGKCSCEKYEDAQREIRYLTHHYNVMAKQYREVLALVEKK